jgi:A/G-specific adenine glycosylase
MPWPSSSDLLAPLAPWFDRVRRALPWRALDLDGPHPDPYAVLVSELMLQQTQVATVVPYFTRWLEEFPTPKTLAEAADDTVHKAWEGLGYYRRARFLKAASASVAAEGWPGDLEGLAGLPGLGPYTAAAVGAIAFQWPTPALDGNAFRVLSRLLLIEGDPKKRAAELRDWLAPALEAHGPSRLTQALMELGATVCLPTPSCGACPLAAQCGAHKAGRTDEIPPVARRAQPKASTLWLVAMEAEGHVLLHPPAAQGLLAGLWRWPTFDQTVLPPQPTAHSPVPLRAWPGWTQVYTHRREALSPIHLLLKARFVPGEGLRWVHRSDLSGLPLGKRDQRLRDLLETPAQAPLVAPEPAMLIRACAGPSA